ncbi:hypothetical protein DFO78_102154 [Bacillus subtilis]|nr:hypothetical protein DFO78_102154 [Bacillus subtilis]
MGTRVKLSGRSETEGCRNEIGRCTYERDYAGVEY